jgi:hypothetical protein
MIEILPDRKSRDPEVQCPFDCDGEKGWAGPFVVPIRFDHQPAKSVTRNLPWSHNFRVGDYLLVTRKIVPSRGWLRASAVGRQPTFF